MNNIIKFLNKFKIYLINKKKIFLFLKFKGIELILNCFIKNKLIYGYSIFNNYYLVKLLSFKLFNLKFYSKPSLLYSSKFLINSKRYNVLLTINNTYIISNNKFLPLGYIVCIIYYVK